jgi:hypothetical protein
VPAYARRLREKSYAGAAARFRDALPRTSTTFLTGSTSDDLWVRATDGIAWSDWKEFHVKEPADSAPNVFGTDTSMTDNTATSVLNPVPYLRSGQ